MKTIVLAAVLCFVPALAWASGCDCGSIQGMITMAHMQTVQQINAHTATEATGIRTEITLAAQNIIGTIRIESAAIVRAIVALKESNAAYLKGLAAARETQKTEDLYGKAAQPGSLCGSTTVGAGIQVGAKAGANVHADMRKKQGDYSNKPNAKPVEYLNRVLEEEHPDVKAIPDAMFPLERTLTPEQLAQAHEATKTLADPRPLPVPTDGQKETPAGQTYAAARIVHQGRVQTAMEALNHHTAFHAPTMPEDVTAWAKEQWEKAGAKGNPPGIVEGKMSEAALYNLLVQMRLGNPNWYSQIASETEAGLLRELVLMQAVQIKIAHKNTEYLDRMSVVMALDYLTRMEGTTGKDMDELYGRMVGTQQ